MEIQIDMYQTLALSVVVLMLGQFLKQKINFLEKFCIPSPVVGGLIFSVFYIAQGWWNLHLMIRFGKSVWYSSLHRWDSRRI